MSQTLAISAEPRRMGDAIQIDGGYQHRALHHGFVVQRFWHAEKLRVIEKFSRPEKGERVLDIGCGSGVISDALCSHGASVTAVDGNPDAIAYARRTFGRPGISFQLGQVEDLPARPASIDRSYCFEVIEHLYINQTERLLRRARDLTRVGGTIALTTPNYHSAWPAIERTLDLMGLVPHLDGDQHVTRFTADRLTDTLVRTGWKVELMTTFCNVAPWLSVAGWGLARKVAHLEDALQLKWGSILLAVARKDAD
jgi:2-polyprenyl-3-methyl-5-hydroxy-6-metoxy-1,4-benzoquinol methylase